MTKNNKLIILISTICLLSACVPAAVYKPYGTGSALTGETQMGYKETEIEDGKWFVQYVATPSQSETDMVKFAMRRANEVGEGQCDDAYRKSNPIIHAENTGYAAGTLITAKSVNITVTCQ